MSINDTDNSKFAADISSPIGRASWYSNSRASDCVILRIVSILLLKLSSSVLSFVETVINDEEISVKEISFKELSFTIRVGFIFPNKLLYEKWMDPR